MYNSDEDEHINLQQQQLGSSLVLFSFSFPPIKIASVHAYPYDTEDVKTALLQRLISAATSAAERLHECCFPFAAAVHFCDCVNAAVATLKAAGALP